MSGFSAWMAYCRKHPTIYATGATVIRHGFDAGYQAGVAESGAQPAGLVEARKTLQWVLTGHLASMPTLHDCVFCSRLRDALTATAGTPIEPV